MANKLQKAEEVVNRRPSIYLGILTALFVGALGIYGFLGAHIFNEVAAAPKTYQTVDEHNRDVDDIKEQLTRVEDKIDDGFQEMRRMIIDLNK